MLYDEERLDLNPMTEDEFIMVEREWSKGAFGRSITAQVRKDIEEALAQDRMYGTSIWTRY